MNILMYIVCGIIAYFIGGITIANLISKKVIGKKISEVGSGNTGASNMIRNCGWKAGLITLAFDALKAVGAILLSKLIVGSITGEAAGDIASYVASISVIVGHIWPVVSKFKGGKGVACTLGAVFVLMPVPAIIILAVGALATVIFKTMSIASFAGLILMVVFGFVLYPGNIGLQITVCIIFAITVFCHRQNIKRLIKGEEAKVSLEAKEIDDKEK